MDQLRRADADERTRENVRGIVDPGMDPGITNQSRQPPQRRRENRLCMAGSGGEGES